MSIDDTKQSEESRKRSHSNVQSSPEQATVSIIQFLSSMTILKDTRDQPKPEELERVINQSLLNS